MCGKLLPVTDLLLHEDRLHSYTRFDWDFIIRSVIERFSRFFAESSMEPGKLVDSLPRAVDLMYKERMSAWKKWFESYSGPYLLNATSSKKVKDGEYLVKISFEVGMDGNITLLSLICSPHYDYVIEQITNLMSRPPTLPHPVWSDGQERKALMIQPVTLVKKRE